MVELHPARQAFTRRKSSSVVPASGIADFRERLCEAVSKLLLKCLNNQKMPGGFKNMCYYEK